MIPRRPADILAAPVPFPARSRFRSAAALVLAAAACESAPPRAPVTDVHRAVAESESARRGLGTSRATNGGTRTGSIAAHDESAARRLAARRSMVTRRVAQDEAYAKRADDASFLEAYAGPARDDAGALYLHGRALGKLGRLQEAATEFEAASLADPKNPYPHEGLGICAYLRDQYDTAIRILKKALELDPQCADARFALATTLKEANRIDEALAEARLCAADDEDPARAPLLVVSLLMRQDKTQDALAALEPAVARAPTNVSLRLALADVLDRLGRSSDAAKELESVLSKTTLSPEKLEALATIYRRAEEFDRAIGLLERLLAEAPESYWKLHPRAPIEKRLETVKQEKAAGHRIDYTADELIRILESHPDAERRQFALQALRTVQHPEIAQVFANALKDSSPEIRMAAVREVAMRVGDVAAKALAVVARGDRDARVRASALEALARIAADDSGPVLVQALADDDAHVREVANRALELYTGRILHVGNVETLDAAGRAELMREWTACVEQRKRK